MATTTHPNTGVITPDVGTRPGPQYGNDLNTALGDNYDQHDHTSGKGVRITPAGININETLTYNNNPLTLLSNLNFQVTDGTSAAVTRSLFTDGTDLFFQDGNDNMVKLTLNGNLNVAAGNISGITGQAAVSYNSLTDSFTFTDDAGNTASVNVESVVLAGTTNNSVTLTHSATATRSLNLPDVSDTLVARTTTDTLTNKTLTSPSVTNITGTSNNLIARHNVNSLTAINDSGDATQYTVTVDANNFLNQIDIANISGRNTLIVTLSNLEIGKRFFLEVFNVDTNTDGTLVNVVFFDGTGSQVSYPIIGLALGSGANSANFEIIPTSISAARITVNYNDFFQLPDSDIALLSGADISIQERDLYVNPVANFAIEIAQMPRGTKRKVVIENNHTAAVTASPNGFFIDGFASLVVKVGEVVEVDVHRFNDGNVVGYTNRKSKNFLIEGDFPNQTDLQGFRSNSATLLRGVFGPDLSDGVSGANKQLAINHLGQLTFCRYPTLSANTVPVTGLNNSRQFNIAFWHRLPLGWGTARVGTADDTVFSMSSTTATNITGRILSTGFLQFGAANASNALVSIGTATGYDNSSFGKDWVHWAITATTTEFRIYRNGVELFNVTGITSITSVSPTSFDLSNTTSDGQLSMDFEDIWLQFNSTWTADQVLQIYDAGRY